jgi:hypothetical protein
VILTYLNIDITLLKLIFKLMFSRHVVAKIQTFNLVRLLSTGSQPIICRIKITEVSPRSITLPPDFITILDSRPPLVTLHDHTVEIF